MPRPNFFPDAVATTASKQSVDASLIWCYFSFCRSLHSQTHFARPHCGQGLPARQYHPPPSRGHMFVGCHLVTFYNILYINVIITVSLLDSGLPNSETLFCKFIFTGLQPGPRSASGYSHRAACTPAAPQPCCNRSHQCPQSSPLMQTSIRCYFFYAGRSIRGLISLGRIEDKAYPPGNIPPTPRGVH